MDRDQVKRAMAVLSSAVSRTRTPEHPGEGPGKYSEVPNFADPGYLDSTGKPAKGGNGVKRYPLNTAARVRNAAARFAQNKGRYSSAQQSAIMGKIRRREEVRRRPSATTRRQVAGRRRPLICPTGRCRANPVTVPSTSGRETRCPHRSPVTFARLRLQVEPR